MPAIARAKAADRQAVLKKLLPLLKKQYQAKVNVPKLDRPVMETLLYAVCLENAPVDEAERAYRRIGELFPDMNEARVSAITELEPIFEGLDEADWRAHRLRSVLQYVFEKSFNFELEGLKKKTLELATKQLAKIRYLSSFVRTFALQQAIGAHLLPIDEAARRSLVWLGLVNHDASHDEVGETLKAVVRKAEAQAFLFSLRSLATDKKIRPVFDPHEYPIPEEGHDPSTAIDRLTELWKSGPTAFKVKAKPAAAASASKSGEKASESAKDPTTKEAASKDKSAKDKAAGTKPQAKKPAGEKAGDPQGDASLAKSGDKSSPKPVDKAAKATPKTAAKPAVKEPAAKELAEKPVAGKVTTNKDAASKEASKAATAAGSTAGPSKKASPAAAASKKPLKKSK